MRTYVIYDRKSGELLQTHVQTDEPHGHLEDILKMARPEGPADAVGIMPVDDLAPGTGYRVDVKAKKLIRIEAGEARGAGAASVQAIDADPHVARPVFVREERRRA